MRNYYLYLIRHGVTQGNLDGRYIGQTDLSLCPEGKREIENYCSLEMYPDVQKVYSSPLARCLETAEIIYPDRRLMIIDELQEMNFGDFENKSAKQLEDLREYKDWLRGGRDSAPPNGEKFGDFILRCVEGLDLIFKDMIARELQYCAAVTHGGVITNLLSGCGLPKGKPTDFMCRPGEGYEIVLTPFLWQKGPTFEISAKITLDGGL